MTCAICFSDITAATGKTVLGCKHEFHLSCIGTWLLGSAAASCPCCRTAPGKYERLTAPPGQEQGSVDREIEIEREGEALVSSIYLTLLRDYPNNSICPKGGWDSFCLAHDKVFAAPPPHTFSRVKMTLTQFLEDSLTDQPMAGQELLIYREGLINIIATMTLCGITG